MEWIEMALCASASIHKTDKQTRTDTGDTQQNKEDDNNDSVPSTNQDAKNTQSQNASDQSDLFPPGMDIGSGIPDYEENYFDTYTDFSTSMMAPPGKISYEVFIEIVKQMKKTAVSCSEFFSNSFPCWTLSAFDIWAPNLVR